MTLGYFVPFGSRSTSVERRQTSKINDTWVMFVKPLKRTWLRLGYRPGDLVTHKYTPDVTGVVLGVDKWWRQEKITVLWSGDVPSQLLGNYDPLLDDF